MYGTNWWMAIAGREPHLDFSCNSTWSAQLKGRKRWRFLPPDTGAVHRHVADAAEAAGAQPWPVDGVVGFEVTLDAGDIVVWGPGWTHGTNALQSESVALSMEFDAPRPTALLAAHRTLLEAHSKLFHSWSHCGWL